MFYASLSIPNFLYIFVLIWSISSIMALISNISNLLKLLLITWSRRAISVLRNSTLAIRRVSSLSPASPIFDRSGSYSNNIYLNNTFSFVTSMTIIYFPNLLIVWPLNVSSMLNTKIGKSIYVIQNFTSFSETAAPKSTKIKKLGLKIICLS